MSEKKKIDVITISPANYQVIQLRLIGTAPYLQNRFGDKARAAMREKMVAGSTVKKGVKRDARDFDADFRQAMHISSEGWVGVPAPALRNACIDVCRMVGYKMTFAKMSIFIQHDGLDASDGMPLVRLDAGEPEHTEMPVRNATGVFDIRARPMWREWALTARVRFDADQFTATDVVNLLARAGEQCGIGEGRPFSKNSNGLGYGTFRIAE